MQAQDEVRLKTAARLVENAELKEVLDKIWAKDTHAGDDLISKVLISAFLGRTQLLTLDRNVRH